PRPQRRSQGRSPRGGRGWDRRWRGPHPAVAAVPPWRAVYLHPRARPVTRLQHRARVRREVGRVFFDGGNSHGSAPLPFLREALTGVAGGVSASVPRMRRTILRRVESTNPRNPPTPSALRGL